MKNTLIRKWKITTTRDRCYDFLKYFRQKIRRKNCHFWLKTKLNYAKFWSQHWFLRKTPIFFAEKLSKIAENCDHNIDPRSDSEATHRSFRGSCKTCTSFTCFFVWRDQWGAADGMGSKNWPRGSRWTRDKYVCRPLAAPKLSEWLNGAN
jgi:hypothetical protein